MPVSCAYPFPGSSQRARRASLACVVSCVPCPPGDHICDEQEPPHGEDRCSLEQRAWDHLWSGPPAPGGLINIAQNLERRPADGL